MPTSIVLRALQADITTLAVDAIVNAANTSLREILFCCFSAPDLAAYERLLL